MCVCIFVLLKVLRPKLVDEKFMKNLGKFLGNVQLIDAGSTQIQSATGLFLYSSILKCDSLMHSALLCFYIDQ